MGLLSSIDSIEKVEGILFTAFPSLLNAYEAIRIVPLVEKYLLRMQPGVRTAVMSFFAEEGYALEYQPRKPIFDYGLVRESLANTIGSILESLTLQPRLARL
ncbi:MAG: hypothetical protein QME81_16370 [bacterium]|nr:hypothetical protein [bacterium]